MLVLKTLYWISVPSPTRVCIRLRLVQNLLLGFIPLKSYRTSKVPFSLSGSVSSKIFWARLFQLHHLCPDSSTAVTEIVDTAG